MKKIVYLLISCFLVIACGDNLKPAKEISIEPTEEIIAKYSTKDFSIVLDDMKIEEETNLTVYQHKYNILTVKNDSLHFKNLPWQTVSEGYFTKHKNDLGMEIVSNHDDKLTRVAKPIGFGWAVGNDKHGSWENVKSDSTKIASSNTNTNRRWRTSTSSFFFWYWLASRRSTYRNDYRSYQSHANRGAAYYGANAKTGTHDYGTRSKYQKSNRSSFFTRKKTNASRWNSFSNKTSKSSSRYSNGSTTRSRSGGFGK